MAETNDYAYQDKDDQTIPLMALSPFEPNLASRGRRLLAQIIDTLILMALSLPVNYILTGSWFTQSTADIESTSYFQRTLFENDYSGVAILQTLLGLIFFFCVQYWSVSKHSQTLGKMAMGIVIVDHNTMEPASLGTIFLKRIALLQGIAYIPLVGGLIVLSDSFFIFGKSRRCLHDLIAGTSVIRKQRGLS